MDYETKIKMIDTELENCETYIDYLNDNLKQLHDVFDEIEREL